MKRRDFIKKSAGAGLLGALATSGAPVQAAVNAALASSDRKYWVALLAKIAEPILRNLAEGTLRKNMPVAGRSDLRQSRAQVSSLEGFGRLLCGMAPWLEHSAEDPEEEALRLRYGSLARVALHRATDPKSPDFMIFNRGKQPLVDAAFLSHAVMRAPNSLWKALDSATRQQLRNALVSSRAIIPYEYHWILFSAMIEVALQRMTGEGLLAEVEAAVNRTAGWYLGDGVFGDGGDFYFNYYNSYVIQPFLLEILRYIMDIDAARKARFGETYTTVLRIGARYAQIQERMIMADGSFPPIGRSLAYRVGAFQLLAQMALWEKLPPQIHPGQVRAALTAAMKRTMEAPGTFDRDGWLTIGLCGYQPEIGEGYISTGSLYHCATAFLPLGLPESNRFWADPSADWTAKRAWQGRPFDADRELKSSKVPALSQDRD